MDWINRVAPNLFAVSQEKEDLKKAFREWFFTFKVFDWKDSVKVCDICGNKRLRYHYEMRNSYNGAKLSIGSDCILHFLEELGVLLPDADGNELTETEAAALFRKLLSAKKTEEQRKRDEADRLERERQAQAERARKKEYELLKRAERDRALRLEEERQARIFIAFSALRRAGHPQYAESFSAYFAEHGALTPRQLAYLFAALPFDYRLVYSDWTVTVDTEEHRDQLLQLSQRRLKIIWPVLTDEQRAWCYYNRNDVPSPHLDKAEEDDTLVLRNDYRSEKGA